MIGRSEDFWLSYTAPICERFTNVNSRRKSHGQIEKLSPEGVFIVLA